MMTKKWQPYPTYKDSGVEWLGEVPEEWNIWKFNHFAPIITCGVAATPEYVDEGVIFLSAQNIKKQTIVLDDYKYISHKTHKQLTKHRKVEKGDILLSRVGTIGEACIVDVDYDFSIFVSLTHIRINQAVCLNKFLVYFFQSKYAAVLAKVITVVGGGVGNLNVNDLREYKIPIPPLPEQQKIAEFLDQETGKIDKLITKKERLIKLLKEKRTALISHAVTKGLNPDVPMKDSGVEWLGEIPEHWEIVPLRSVLEQRIEYNIGRKTENILSVIKDVGVVNYEDREASGNKKSENIEQYKIIYPSDIVVNRMNLIFGSVGIAREYGASSTEYYVLKPKSNKVCQEYYGHIFCSKSFQLSLVGIGKGILFHRMRIYSEELKKILFPFPPLEEQKLINEYLIQNLNEINHLSDKLNTSIDHLKEYRTALISAAVTGKIDVREH